MTPRAVQLRTRRHPGRQEDEEQVASQQGEWVSGASRSIITPETRTRDPERRLPAEFDAANWQLWIYYLAYFPCSSKV